MAIAASPLAPCPPYATQARSRRVAILSQVGPCDRLPACHLGDQPGPDELLEIAAGLAKSAPQWPGMAQPRRRQWDLMVASDTFEAWVIGWPPGGSIALHDHGGSAGAVVVATGELLETRVSRTHSGDVVLRTRSLQQGGSIRIDGNDVHDIVNASTSTAISVHVYAPRMTSMTYYRWAENTFEALHTIDYRVGEAVP